VGGDVFQICSGGARSPEESWNIARPTCHAIVRSVLDVSADPRPELGRLGERLAAEHLIRRGFQIVERNYRTRWGELDIVAYDGRTLAFCEVKTRRLRTPGRDPLESVHLRKRSKVRKMAGRWLTERTDRPYAANLRFDAIGVTLDASDRLVRLEHLEGAF
jgi:putative endonuclease